MWQHYRGKKTADQVYPFNSYLTPFANRFNHNLYRPGSGHYQYPIPNDDGLGCTPLNGAILLSEHVIRKFKKENNL